MMEAEPFLLYHRHAVFDVFEGVIPTPRILIIRLPFHEVIDIIPHFFVFQTFLH